jgi:hypothetical protein
MYKGVAKDKKKWRAYVCIKYKVYFLGFFATELQASLTRDLEVVRLGYAGIMILNHPDLLATYQYLLKKIQGTSATISPFTLSMKYLSEVL